MPTALVNGVRIHYIQTDGADRSSPEGEDRSSREDLVAVHGLATNLAFWYLAYAPAFARRFRVTLLDLRGHGRSEMTRSGYSPMELSGDLCALLDHLRIDKAHLVGHSFGGVVAMRFALAQPHRVRSLVLADTHISALRKDGHEWPYGRRFQPVLDALELDLDTQDPWFGYRLLTCAARWRVQGKSVPPELAELVAPMGGIASRTAEQWLELMDGTSAAADFMGDDQLTPERLRTFRFPILAMYAENSQARRTGSRLQELWPHAEFHRMRDAGHFFPATRPEEVIACCERFWTHAFAPLQAAE